MTAPPKEQGAVPKPFPALFSFFAPSFFSSGWKHPPEVENTPGLPYFSRPAISNTFAMASDSSKV